MARDFRSDALRQLGVPYNANQLRLLHSNPSSDTHACTATAYRHAERDPERSPYTEYYAYTLCYACPLRHTIAFRTPYAFSHAKYHPYTEYDPDSYGAEGRVLPLDGGGIYRVDTARRSDQRKQRAIPHPRAGIVQLDRANRIPRLL